MARNKLSELEIEILNATRKFANQLNRENHNKMIYFAGMEDEPGSDTNCTIFKVSSLGPVKIYGYARAILYLNGTYSSGDGKIKIDGSKIHDKRTEYPVFHNIVEEYKQFLIREIPGIKRRIVEENQDDNYKNNHYNNYNSHL